jgi:hypothetical protein
MTGRRRELARFVGQIQTLEARLVRQLADDGRAGQPLRLSAPNFNSLELNKLQHRALGTPEVDAKGRTLERLRRQLAAVAQRIATDEHGNAA